MLFFIFDIIITSIWGLGIGDWGLGIGDWGLGPIPTRQSPIPYPQSPIPKHIHSFSKVIIKLLN